MLHAIRELIENGFTLVTANNRIARYLQHHYAIEQLDRGLQAWETVKILPWRVWLNHFWEELAVTHELDYQVLTPQQQQLIWQQLVAGSKYARQLLHPATTAKKAIEAWELCQQWQLTIFPQDNYLNEDARAFQAWAQAYQQRCAAQGWLDESSLANVLAEKIQTRKIKINSRIAFIGFDEFLPQQQSLFAVLKSSGCEIHELALLEKNQKINCLGFADVQEEIFAAANWARGLLQSNRTPAAMIGIVLPNLPALRHQLENSLDDVLCPGAILSSPESINRPYSISLGATLSSYPLIHTALAILALGKRPILLDELGGVLRSPFIKDARQEQIKRARLDACLRDIGEQQLTTNSIHYIASHYLATGDQCPVFLDCMHQCQEILQPLPAKQSIQQWAGTFSQMLKIVDWPGDRTLTSEEYQTVEAWRELISQFAALELVAAPLTYSAALSQLRQLAAMFSFQPKTQEVPVQVLGLAGAAGLQFDHLWVMGLHEAVWPAPAESNPFIPIALQRQSQLPNVSAELKLAHAKQMTQRLVSSAQDVILSYPQNDNDRPLRPSPLLKDYQLPADALKIAKHTSYIKTIHASRQYQYLGDDKGPVIPAGQAVTGGAGLFKDIAACPFRAFARHRLNAYGLGSTDIGLDPMDRGLLLHKVMQLIWEQLGEQKKLLAMPAPDLAALIADAVAKSIKQYKKRRPQTFTERFSKLEVQRLTSLINDWFTLERKRQAFTVIACEQEHIFNYKGIEVRTRIDRIDQLDDGRYVVIDYKTGDVKLNAWFDERPDEPQLPLYAVTSKGEIAAIAFARLKRGNNTYIGIANGEDIIPGVKTWQESRYNRDFSDWETLFKQWDECLTGLANAYREGDARVDPKDATSCRYCDLHALCRIYERRQTDG